MAKNPKYDPTDPAVVPRFADMATLLRCNRMEATKEVDIGLTGVPFDLAVNYRSGQRQGPSAVREASRLIRRCHPTLGIAPFDIANVADIGDCPINPMNKDESIQQIEDYFDTLIEKDITPIAIGGDHTIPLPILRALKKKYGKMGILHVDAHADVLDTICGDKINHATFMRRAMEEEILDPDRVIQLGLRGSRFEPEDFQYSYDVGYNVITMDDYDKMGRDAAIKKIVDVLGEGPVYIPQGDSPGPCVWPALKERLQRPRPNPQIEVESISARRSRRGGKGERGLGFFAENRALDQVQVEIAVSVRIEHRSSGADHFAEVLFATHPVLMPKIDTGRGGNVREPFG